jgi:hypothetical protein
VVEPVREQRRIDSQSLSTSPLGLTEVPAVFGSTKTTQRLRASADELERPETFLLRLVGK